MGAEAVCCVEGFQLFPKVAGVREPKPDGRWLMSERVRNLKYGDRALTATLGHLA